MAITVTSTRLPISPDTPVSGVYVMIPKDSVAFLPSDHSWAFQIRYFLNADARKAEKVYSYFRDLADKPSTWSDARWAKSQSVKVLQVTPVFALGTHTTNDLGVADPTDVNEALTRIYVWVKANTEPDAVDVLDDTTIEDIVEAYFISQGL